MHRNAGTVSNLKSTSPLASGDVERYAALKSHVNPYAPPVLSSDRRVTGTVRSILLHLLAAYGVVTIAELLMHYQRGWQQLLLIPLAVLYPIKVVISRRFSGKPILLASAYACWAALAITSILFQILFQKPFYRNVLDSVQIGVLIALSILAVPTFFFLVDARGGKPRSLTYFVWRSVIELAILSPIFMAVSSHPIQLLLNRVRMHWSA